MARAPFHKVPQRKLMNDIQLFKKTTKTEVQREGEKDLFREGTNRPYSCDISACTGTKGLCPVSKEKHGI